MFRRLSGRHACRKQCAAQKVSFATCAWPSRTCPITSSLTSISCSRDVTQFVKYSPARHITTTPSHFTSRSQSKSSQEGPYHKYMRLVEKQEIAADSAQLEALRLLQDLHERFQGWTPPDLEEQDLLVVEHAQATRDRRLAKQQENEEERKMLKLSPQSRSQCDDPTATVELSAQSDIAKSIGETPPGIYLWGSVGCGKTFIMDLFYDAVQVPDGRKQRVHFHNFMRDVLKHMHVLHQQSTHKQKLKYDHNMLRPLAKAISKQSVLLCFDEIQIPDIGTAAVLYRLFKHLEEYGVTIVATSNQSPAQLYQGHFCQTYFEPWVEMMEGRWHVHEVASDTDYRTRMMAGVGLSAFDPSDSFSETFFTPLDASSTTKMDLCWQHQVGDQSVQSNSITSFGKTIQIPKCSGHGVASFTFHELCDRPLGPKDYLALAQNYHTLFVYEIPKMTMQTRDQARRLISLIDALYECKTKLYCSAQLLPDQMFEAVADGDFDRYDAMYREVMGDMFSEMNYGDQVFQNKLFTGEEELFASNRCVSRLFEMQSPRYKEQPHMPHLAEAGLRLDLLELGDPNDTITNLSDKSSSNDVLSRYAKEMSLLHNVPSDNYRVDSSKLEPTLDLRPRFSDKHFWGGGRWEKIKDRVRPEKKL
eukprot:m.229683 g.229683  ORF g.229683 m.229683 type:complete len:645 (-) comp33563_c0_seq31:523-2457(-)